MLQSSYYRILVLALVFAICNLSFVVSLGAATQSDLQAQIEATRKNRDALIAEQQKLQAQLDAVNKEAQTLGTAVKSLDTTKKKLTKDISITQSKITSTDLAIKSLENTIGEKEAQVSNNKKALAITLAIISRYDTEPLLFSILASNKLTDIWREKVELDGVNARIQEQIQTLRETQNILSNQKQEKQKVKDEQVGLKNQLTGQKSVVEENQKAKQKILADTKNKEAEYQKLLAQNIANQKQFEADLFRLESELGLTVDRSLIPKALHGTLSWPLSNILVTQTFGDTDFARTGAYKGKGHNGVDFKASMGTPVMSMLSGTIEGMGNTDDMNAELRKEGKEICGSYGRWVLIKHDDGLTSIYAHLSASIVKVGQSIKTGEVIGYSGGMPGANGSGYSTGPHLHVGLFASQGVEIRQFATSINCKHEFVPIADPKAYLDPLAYLPSL